jgi:endo-1,4-beta-xylanase
MNPRSRCTVFCVVAFLAACGTSPGDSGASHGSGSGAASSGADSSGVSGSSGNGSGSGNNSDDAGSGSSGASASGSDSGGGSGSSVADASGSAQSDAGAGRKFVGNITTNGAVRSDFGTYWNQITPENEGKWGSVEATQGTYNWTSLDAIYKYAQDSGIPFKEHNFIWNQQQPSWIGGLSESDQEAAVKAWMQAFCTRYPNTKMIDVVNEALHGMLPPYAKAIGDKGVSGFDWVINAFKWARAACPNAILILNDYNIIEYEADNTSMISAVNAIKQAGAPIDAIGAQAHDAYKLPVMTVQKFLDNLATMTGLPVYISEYDINEADDSTQAMIMSTEFPMFWSDSNVKGITLWGYIEGATWEPNTGLMTSSGTKRPAMTWLVDFLKKH